MNISFEALISNDNINHTKSMLENEEILTYYIDNKYGFESINVFNSSNIETNKPLFSISIFNVGHDQNSKDFIRNTLTKLDKIIDLEFLEMPHNNGSMLDIYHVNYSSYFDENIVGQALSQNASGGKWWDIFWKDSQVNSKSDKNTIIHEIGHSLGLSHPYDEPNSILFNSKDTVMSYNEGPDGWNTWFSKHDLDALIKTWGREDDQGFITFENISSNYKFKTTGNEKFFIKTNIGYEDISDVQTLKFSDKSLEVIDDIASVFLLLNDMNDINSKLYRLYNAAFGRFPDISGLKYWIEKNTLGIDSYRETASSFVLSGEFQAIYADEENNNQSYINNLYTNILGRAADEQGFNYWLNQIESGFEDKSELLMGFSESTENLRIFSNETMIF